MLLFGWDGDRSPADVVTAATQGITVGHLQRSLHARQALETLLVAKQCERGRNIVVSPSKQSERQAAEERRRARSVLGGLAEAPGRVSGASSSLLILMTALEV